MQDVYGNADSTGLRGFKSHEQTVTHALPHPYDAPGADFKSYFARQGYGAQLVGMGVCRAKFREKLR